MSRAGFVSLFVAALALRLLLTATSFGSTDALVSMSWAHLAGRFGIGPAYHYSEHLNHPPLGLTMMVAADRLGMKVGLEFPDTFRLFQIVADLFSAAILYQLGARYGRGREFAAFYFASPAAIFLSGFHCNADPTMIALLLAAVWRGSGGLLAAASGIKIAPIPLMPFFLIDLNWRRRLTFLSAWLAVLAAIFLPAVLSGGPTVLHNIFGYPGSGYEWGFCGLGYLSGSRTWAELYSVLGRYVVVAALIALFIIFYRRRTPLPMMIGIALLTMNFFSPAFGVQYLVWPLPFFLFALSRRMAYTLNVALSLFLFATYTIWSREFPWWFADAAAPNPLRPLVALLALPLWLLYGWAAVSAIKAASATTIEP